MFPAPSSGARHPMSEQDRLRAKQFEDEITRVARCMFDWKFPRTDWDNPLYREYRDDAMLMAAQFRAIFVSTLQAQPVTLWSIPDEQGVDARWRQAFVATRMAGVLAELAAGVQMEKLDASDRGWLKGQAESLVEDAVVYFETPIGDSQYRPQDEPEYDFEGRTEEEAQR